MKLHYSRAPGTIKRLINHTRAVIVAHTLCSLLRNFLPRPERISKRRFVRWVDPEEVILATLHGKGKGNVPRRVRYVAIERESEEERWAAGAGRTRQDRPASNSMNNK